MIESINEKILNKIKSSNLDEEVKDFLIKMLFLEFQHSEEERWWGHGNVYEKFIKHFASKYGVKEK